MNIGIISKINGMLLILLGVLTGIPLLLAHYESEDITPWLWCAGTFICVGGLGIFAGLKSDAQKDLGIREGIAITTLFWLAASLIAAIAIWLDVPRTTFMQAWFECMSGLTTTGSTIFASVLDENGVETATPISSLPASILFWRALLQWMGGIGIVVISIALIPLLIGKSGFQLYRAEIPGLNADKLTPRLSTTARILVGFYMAMTLVITLALMLFGTSFFNALCHAMSTVSTGGFSTFDNSAEGLNSSACEWIIIFGMFVGGINFSILLQCLRGKPMSLWNNTEARTYTYMIIVAWAIIALCLFFQSDFYDDNRHDLIRDSLFQVCTIITSSGFGSGYDTTPTSWDAWPPTAMMVIIVLMFCGGCAGSTAGGFKIARIIVLFKSIRRETRRYYEPARVTPITINGQQLNDRTIFQVNAFLFMYIASVALGTLGFALLGHTPSTSLTASLTAISNIGPGIGEIGPSKSFRTFNDASLLLSIWLMLLGRLELLTVLLTFYPKSWRK